MGSHRLGSQRSDIGTHGSPPIRVSEVAFKWTRPARSLVDLQVGPETLEDLGRPYPDRGRPARLVGQAFS
jgi:hypothetical protein